MVIRRKCFQSISWGIDWAAIIVHHENPRKKCSMKQSDDKPGFVSLACGPIPYIYNIGAKWREANHLSTRHVAVSLYRSTLRRSLPVGGKHRAGRPLPSVYLNFQHPRCTPHSVTTWAVVSYTHLLTLTHRPFPRRGKERWAVIFFCTTQLSRTASR